MVNEVKSAIFFSHRTVCNSIQRVPTWYIVWYVLYLGTVRHIAVQKNNYDVIMNMSFDVVLSN